MKKNNNRFDDTGEISFEIIDIDGFADANDFDESGAEFATEDDFDDSKSHFSDEEDYDEEYVEEACNEEVYSEEAYNEEVYSEEAYNEEAYDKETYDEDSYDEDSYDEDSSGEDSEDTTDGTEPEEEYFDDHVEYFFDEHFDDEKVEEQEDISDYIENDADEQESRTNGQIEKLMIGLAASVVLALLLFGGGFFIMKNRASRSESNINENGVVYNAELGGAGAEIAGIDIIGGQGIDSAINAIKGKDDTEWEPDEDFAEVDDKTDEYEETDYKNDIEIAFETISVVKDLKVKMVNKKTGKLIANIPFVVKATTPSGTVQTWTDTDKDGIIYCSDIAAGSYTLHLETLDEKYAGYILPSDTKSTVKAEIAYEKVNVAGEILAAGDVNEAAEDTIRDGADSGNGALVNTVAWVESTKVEGGYVALTDNSVIIMPFELATATYGESYAVVTTEQGDNPDGNDNPSGDDNQTPTGSITLGQNSMNLSVNETGTVDAAVSGPDTSVVSITIDNTGVASAEYSRESGKVTVKGIAGGTANITLVLMDKEGGTTLDSKTLTVTVTKGTIVLNKNSIGVLYGKTASVEVTLSGMTASEVTVSSQASNIATAAFDAEGKKIIITGVAAGTTGIVLTQTADSTVTATLSVTVYATSDKLTANVNGAVTQLYIKDAAGNYKEATFADYSASATFYYASEAKYTGWQTISGKTYFYTAEGKVVTGEQVINGVLYNFDSTGAMVVGSGTLGIDVSKWNGDINWSKVKAAGVSYVIIRVGYRGSTLGGLIDDSNFKKNIEGATAAGLKVGVYFVTQAVNDAEAVYEASMVLDRISKYTISYPVFLDVEASGGRGDKIDVATRTSVCKTFCKTIQNAGYTAGIYANKSWLTSKINTSQLAGYKIWCAQYYSSCTYTGGHQIWQYTDSGTIDGISGKVDLNKSYLGY